MFGGRGCATCPQNNLRQADVPEGGDVIPNPIGTAPGLRVPGRRRQGRLRGAGRAVRDAGDGHRSTCSPTCSHAVGRGGGDRVALAEDVGHVGVGARRDDRAPPRRARRSRQPDDRVPRPWHRGPRRAHHREGARPKPRRARSLDAEETRAARDPRRPRVRGRRRDDGVTRCSSACEARGWTLGVAESLTGGFIGARIANVPGASDTFRGSIASYATEVKRSCSA